MPSDVKGTALAVKTTSDGVLVAMQSAIANGGWSGSQEQTTLAMVKIFDTEAQTLQTRHYANC